MIAMLDDNKMGFFLIKVREKDTGNVHIVGEDVHDSLYLAEDGSIHYHNMQCGDGTGGDGYGYEFVADYEEDEWFYPRFKMYSIDKLKEVIKEHETKIKKLKEIFNKLDEKDLEEQEK